MSKFISEIVMLTSNPKQYELVELKLIPTSLVKQVNPFNYDEVNIEGTFIPERGQAITLKAFWTRDVAISLEETILGEEEASHGITYYSEGEPIGKEIVEFLDEGHFGIRYLPLTSGVTKYQLKVYLKGELIEESEGQFTITENQINYRGIIKVEPNHRRNFIFENGETFIPIGQNVCWYTSRLRKSYDYDVWFSKMEENQMNVCRIWLAPWGFALHWQKIDEYDLANAARLDRVLTLAKEKGIYVMLTLLNHGQFSAKVNPMWDKNPWNKVNGGMLEYPMEFFTNEEAKHLYKNQLQYIVARYGFLDNLLAWELWNEVSWVDDYLKSDAGYKWHDEMSIYLKKIDPYNHLVSTSFHNETNEAYEIPTIDFANPHTYGYTEMNINDTLPSNLEKFYGMYKKPIFHSEIGIDWRSGVETAKQDPLGITLHQQCWAGMLGGGAGSAMNWWWDSHVHPHNLYYRFKGAAKYSQYLDMISNQYILLKDVSTINNPDIKCLGYLLDDRIYGYLYDVNWKYTEPDVKPIENVEMKIACAEGIYQLTIFDTVTGEITEEKVVETVDTNLVLFFNRILKDLAFILKKK